MFVQRPHRLLAAVSAALLIVACAGQDALTAAPARARADLLDLDGLTSSSKSDTQVAVLVIDPLITTAYSLGNGNKLFVRSGGVCDLDSKYGADSWDLPCLGAVLPIVVVAKTWYDDARHPHVDFSPDLRFVPGGDDASPNAELWLRDKSAAYDDGSVIRYCHDAITCVDEASDDKALTTQHDWYSGYVHRRIKHFSGYQVSTGRDGEPTDSSAGPNQ